jgi:hypothetical protein
MKSREPRKKVVIQARLRAGARWSDACILNLSSRGMLVRSAAAPPRGSYLEIRRGPHVIVAQVVWADTKIFGVRTQDRICSDALVKDVPTGTSTPSNQTASIDRRAVPRHSDDYEKHYARAKSFQFVTLIMLGVAGSFLAFGTVSKTFAAPLDRVNMSLSR